MIKLPEIKTPIKIFFGFLISIFLLTLVAEGGYYFGHKEGLKKGIEENLEEEIAQKQNERIKTYQEGIMYYQILGSARYGLAVGRVVKIEDRFLTIESQEQTMKIKISNDAEVYVEEGKEIELAQGDGFTQIKIEDNVQIGSLTTDENGVLIGGTVVIE